MKVICKLIEKVTIIKQLLVFIISFSYVVIFYGCSFYFLFVSFLAILSQSQVMPQRCCRNNVLRQNCCGNTFLAILQQSHLHTKNATAAILLQCINRMVLQYCRNNDRLCCQKINISVRGT